MAKKIYLVRHGETSWSSSGKHTGLSDIPLTAHGKEQAKHLGAFLKTVPFDHVFSSPLQRALETCKLSGFHDKAEISSDLTEWNYGKYEGLTSDEIALIDPSWNLFLQGAPEGESITEIGIRADRMMKKLFLIPGSVLIFSSGHFIRVLVARWLNLRVEEGQLFFISPGSVSVLGLEHNFPVILELNNSCYSN